MTKRSIKNDIETLSNAADGEDRELRQELPSYRELAELERQIGADMSHMVALKERQS